jgi:hypothetical protein
LRACALPVEFWHLTNCENRCVTLLRNSNTQHWIPLQPPTFGKSSTPHCSWSAGRLTGARPLPAAVATGAAASCAPASWLQGALMLPPATLRTRKSGPGQISPRAVASRKSNVPRSTTSTTVDETMRGGMFGLKRPSVPERMVLPRRHRLLLNYNRPALCATGNTANCLVEARGSKPRRAAPWQGLPQTVAERAGCSPPAPDHAKPVVLIIDGLPTRPDARGARAGQANRCLILNQKQRTPAKYRPI